MNRTVAEPRGSRDEQAAAWCMRMAESALKPTEQRQFDEWMADALNRKAYEETVVVWQGVESAADRPELIALRTQALENFMVLNSQRWRRRIPVPVRSSWPAAAIAGLVIAALTVFFVTREGKRIYATGIGERRVVRLEDGSQLSLDATTRVEASLTEGRRDLHLVTGRAKFDVAKDPFRPFSVTVGHDVIVATGTSFSVELLKTQMRVVLYEGHVEVLQKSPDTPTFLPLRIGTRSSSEAGELTPGRELWASVDTPNATVTSTDVARSLSWESGQLNFVSEPLESAVERMNRYSREKLVIADDRAAASTINGVFNAGDTQAFVEAVTAFAPITAVEQSGQLILRSRPVSEK